MSVAELLVTAIELTRLTGELMELAQNNGEPTEEQIERMRTHLRRANALWEAAAATTVGDNP